MTFHLHFATALACAITLSGCASSPETDLDRATFKATGSVDSAILDSPSAEQYQVKPRESFLRPHKVLSNAKPLYPEHLLSRRLPPVEVQIRIVVGADGAVTSVTPIGPTSEQSEPFLSSVITALSTWRFYPLFKIDESGQAVKLPFHQDYAFTFKQIDGKAVVSESGVQS